MGQSLLDAIIDGDIVHLSGALTFDAHQRWRQLLRDLPAPVKGTVLRLNMAKVDRLDAAGLGLLMITQETLAGQGAALVLAGSRGNVRRILEVSGINALVTLED